VAMRKLWRATEPTFLEPESNEELLFCGMQIKATARGLHVHQRTFTEELLRLWGMAQCRPSATPGDKADGEATTAQKAKEIKHKENKEQKEKPDAGAVHMAQRLCGSLQWLASRTRPDIACTVHRAASMATTFPELSLKVGIRLLRFLANSRSTGLLYRPFSLNCAETFCTYTDASWAPDGGEESQLGAVIVWSGAPVAWRSTRATLAAMSSCESELQATAMGITLGSGVEALLESIGLKVGHVLCVDNTAALAVLAGRTTWRTRHLAARARSLRGHVRMGLITTRYVPTDMQLADVLTKHATAIVYQRIASLLGVTAMELADNR